MRQTGVLAAAGLVAFDSMIERLADDHANARRWRVSWRRWQAYGY
jgi:threonine aldolase